MKQKKITPTMQKVAVDILEELEIYMMSVKEYPEEIGQIFNKMCEKYGLCDDPFTRMICTPEEFYKNSLEYERQTAEEKYGHCDWID